MNSIRRFRISWAEGITAVGLVTGIAAATSVLLQHGNVIQGTALPAETIATAVLAVGGLLAALGGQYVKLRANPPPATTGAALAQYERQMRALQDTHEANAASIAQVEQERYHAEMMAASPPARPPRLDVGVWGASDHPPYAMRTVDGNSWLPVSPADYDGRALPGPGCLWLVAIDSSYANSPVEFLMEKQPDGQRRRVAGILPLTGLAEVTIPAAPAPPVEPAVQADHQNPT